LSHRAGAPVSPFSFLGLYTPLGCLISRFFKSHLELLCTIPPDSPIAGLCRTRRYACNGFKDRLNAEQVLKQWLE
jgi:hypothetical protein